MVTTESRFSIDTLFIFERTYKTFFGTALLLQSVRTSKAKVDSFIAKDALMKDAITTISCLRLCWGILKRSLVNSFLSIGSR
jgi:hypothetical protein